MDALSAKERRIKNDALDRLRYLRLTLDSIERRVKAGDILNDLGEIQGESNMLDCRLASLAVVRQLLEDSPEGQL